MSFTLIGTTYLANVDVSPVWGKVIGSRKLLSATFAEFDTKGRLCLGLIETDDGIYEVGRAEFSQPYAQYYKGKSHADASKMFTELLTCIDAISGDSNLDGSEVPMRQDDPGFWDAYEQLSILGHCNPPGGVEYQSVHEEWVEEGRPADVKGFIMAAANPDRTGKEE